MFLYRSSNMLKFKGKTVLITGCNRGIGLYILKAFINESASIIACTRVVDDDLLNLYHKLAQEYGVSIYPVAMDLSDEESIKSGMKEVSALKLPIDVLINNAGIAKFKPFAMTRIDDFREMMQVNVYAPALISQYVVKNMLKQKKGCIINFSSISGLDTNAGNAAYGVSKAAITSLSRTMSRELAKANIRVNAIAPGFVDTDMNKQIADDYLDSMKQQISLGRIANPEEVASLVLYLASDEASYITGQVIRIDGGM